MAEMSKLEEINSNYMDILTELGNIGAGNATTAVADMLSLKIDMKVPKVKLLGFNELATAICPEDEVIVGIYFMVTGGIEGSMMFLLPMKSAHYLVNTLMMRDLEYEEPFDEMDLSALKEVGNIIAGSYLSALAELTHMMISPSTPAVAIDMEASILSVPAIEFGQYGDDALLIETEIAGDINIDGYYILLPEPDSYEKILSSLGITM